MKEDNVTVVEEHSQCCYELCTHKALIRPRPALSGDVCVEHWLQSIGQDQKVPFLGTGIGQVLMTKEQEALLTALEYGPKSLQIVHGNDKRYTMLVRGNRVVYTQDRKYNDLETDPPVLKCVFDIMLRLIPHESDIQDGGIKIWLQKARGGKW